MAETLVDSNGSLIKQKIDRKIAEVASYANDIPGVVIVHDLKNDLSVVYMSQKGTEILGVSLDEIKALGPDYHNRFFNAEESKEYVPKILNLLERNKVAESISFFQQVRGINKEIWTWYLTTMKVILWDDAGAPLLLFTLAVEVDAQHPITTKVARLLEENNFLRKNFHYYSKLSKREKQILKLMAMGKSSLEIATELFISVSTADTHRRNIRQKLKANTTFEIAQYARAFDLI